MRSAAGAGGQSSDAGPPHLARGDLVYRGPAVPCLVAAEGVALVDEDGYRYLDAEASSGTANLGFDATIPAAAAARRVASVPALPSFLESRLRKDVAARLAARLEHATGRTGRVAFELGGAQGVELALKVVRRNTARVHLAVLEGGFHGRSGLASQLSSGHALRQVTGEWRSDGMWRSLAVTSGDLVVFMDTDIANPGPHFVSSVLGPLLVEEDTQLVKGFYRRPILVGGVYQAGEGGRVTELSARPLLNAFWPALGGGLVQPLSGEFAARRSLLESIPFSTGYGVEIGILVDTFVLAGLEAIAQVDLGERVHRNQPIAALSRMAFEVTQAAARRLARHGLLAPGAGERGRYLQFTPVESGRPRPVEQDVNVTERPPLREYARRPR